MSEPTKKPKYELAEVPEGVINPAEPIKKTIAKTMETTENFNIFDVLTYIAKLKKAIEDKKSETVSLETMLKAYEDELAVIEEELGIQKKQEAWEKAEAERIQKEADEKPVPSPYVEEESK